MFRDWCTFWVLVSDRQTTVKAFSPILFLLTLQKLFNLQQSLVLILTFAPSVTVAFPVAAHPEGFRQLAHPEGFRQLLYLCSS